MKKIPCKNILRLYLKLGELIVNYLGAAGQITSNGANGVFGFLDTMPTVRVGAESVPVGLRNDITEGDAWMYCTVDFYGVQAYKINIIEVYDKTK